MTDFALSSANESFKGFATFSDCKRYRFDLVRRWTDGEGVLLAVMLNPSKADAYKNDNTVARLCNYARRRDFRAKPFRELVVCNLFAFCATDPDEMAKAARSGIDIVGDDNDDMIRFHAETANLIIVAWGSMALAKPRALEVCTGRGPLADKPLHALRVMKGGAPEHPLYLPRELTPEPYALENLDRWVGPRRKARQ